MLKKIESAHRRLLLLVVAAGLLTAAASPLAAGESAAGEVRLAGLNVSVGFHGHHGHYRGHGHYRPYHHYYGYHPYRFFYPRVYYHGTYGVPRYASRFGGLDLNVKPKKTQVYVDGNYVGLTGAYDGWPEHLWLPVSRLAASGGTNSYELIFYNPGYKTVVRHVELQPGVVIKIRDDMQPGDSIPPEELTTARRQQPAPRHQQQTAPAPVQPRYQQPATPAPAPPYQQPAAPAPMPMPPDMIDAGQQSARLKLSVAPADAAVYLDGHFLGVAGEIGRPSGILIDPGEHRLEIIRPGYNSHILRFDADPGGEVELEVELESESDAARTGLSA